MKNKNILIIGAGGQIGTVLLSKLRATYGSENIFATDINPNESLGIEGVDVLDKDALEQVIVRNKIEVIFHLAAILSAKGEQNPKMAWNVNMGGLFNILELSVAHKIKRLFYPSTIAVFGNSIPLKDTPNQVPLIPATVYGISKVSGELWGKYFYEQYGLDVRSVRYPGVIGYQSLPGGGTTDYAVDIFHAEAKKEPYTCFLSESTKLPMIYMDDCIKATIDIMNAPIEAIKIRTSYNIAGVSFSPEELATEIQKHNPDFTIKYAPDYRQKIASTWPQSIDDSMARNDWGWMPTFGLKELVDIMLQQVRLQY